MSFDPESKTTQSTLRAEIRLIGRHSGVYVIGQGLSRAVGFFMIPVYTRFISPGNYGAMELIEIIAGAVMMIISMGASDSMARFYYAEKDPAKQNRIISTAIVGFGIIGLPIVFLFVLMSGALADSVLEKGEYRFYLQIALTTAWFGMVCEIGFTYLRMRYLAKLFVALTTGQLLLALFLNIYFVVFLQLDILGIFYSTLITEGIIGISLSFMIWRKVRQPISFPLLWRLITFGLPLVPARIGLMLGFVSNRFFLRWLSSPDPAVALAQVGLFSLGHKFGVIINRLVNAPFNSFWNPRRLDLLLREEAGAKETIGRVCTYATLGSVYIALLLSAGIESVITIMADPNYQGAHEAVPFIALTYVLLGLETHFTTGILYKKRTIWLTYVSILSIGLILGWNFIFVPKYGLLGAATSNLAGFGVRIFLIYLISQYFYPIPFEWRRIGILLSLAVILYTISQFIGFPSPYLTFMARTGLVALFPLFLFLIRFYTKEETRLIVRILQKGREKAAILVLPVRRGR